MFCMSGLCFKMETETSKKFSDSPTRVKEKEGELPNLKCITIANFISKNCVKSSIYSGHEFLNLSWMKIG